MICRLPTQIYFPFNNLTILSLSLSLSLSLIITVFLVVIAALNDVHLYLSNPHQLPQFSTCIVSFISTQRRYQEKQMGGDGKVFTLAQVSEHNTPKDCWLIISGKVYDVTRFLEDHPGGDDVLVSATGKDATDDFEDVGHSENARGMLKDFYVGEIDASTIPKSTTYTPPKQPHYNQDKTSEFIVKLLQFLVPIAILGLAFGVHLYTKSS